MVRHGVKIDWKKKQPKQKSLLVIFSTARDYIQEKQSDLAGSPDDLVLVPIPIVRVHWKQKITRFSSEVRLV